MKFVIKGSFRENIHTLMRRAGYWFQKRNETEKETVFARPAKGYPRFHLFLKTKGESLVFNLHLDQKKPSYEGSKAHSGEYESEIVKKEAQRIKNIINPI